MIKRKNIRDRGKLGLSRLFQTLKPGDKVALMPTIGSKTPFPLRMTGKTGIVIGQRGKAFVVSIKDGNKEKKIIARKIHLKKLK